MNTENIQNAILEVEAGPLAKQAAADLVDAYVARYSESDINKFKVIDVERAWFLWLEPLTLLVGQKDARLEDSAGPLLLELKTHREARRTKAGEYYKGEGPQSWLADISTGIQLGIYALHEAETTGAESVRVMVRAAVKSTPPEFWPLRDEDGTFAFSRDYLKFVRNALVVRAAEIRAARAKGVYPWDWSGYKCQHMYGKTCQFWEEMCSKHLHPIGRNRVFSKTDPGAAAIEAGFAERNFEVEPEDPKVVILSASAYEDYSTCRERGRIIQDGLSKGDESMELEIGSCFHAGVAQFHRELQLMQQPITSVTFD